MVAQWNAQQVLDLAPDAGSAQAGKGLAQRNKWHSAGRSDRALWGEIKGSGKNPYQVRIDLSEPAFKCSCPSRKFPCKHGLGLFLIYAEAQSTVSQTEPPDWVRDWLTQRDARQEKRSAPPAEKSEVDVAAQAKRAVKREEKVQAGVEALSIWLTDLVAQGLGAAQKQPMSFWSEIAARMVDAQAPGLARSVRQLSELASSGEGWQSRMLAAIGRLYLLLQAYQRMDALPGPLQADVRAGIGWTTPKEELLAGEKVGDTWTVLSNRIEREEQLRVQRTWLWGVSTGRPALILQFAAGTQMFETSFATGTQFAGELAFYPSAVPLRAMLVTRTDPGVVSLETLARQTISHALGEYAGVLARLPWLDRWPMRLSGVTLFPRTAGGADSWRLRDDDGRQIPVHPAFQAGWRLLSISGGSPIDVFGEWDGDTLRPLSAVARGRLYTIAQTEEQARFVRVA